MKRMTSLVVATALAMSVSVTAQPSYADKDTAKAIAGVVALGILGAALADHQRKKGYSEYQEHPRLHPDENAVGRCMHTGLQAVEKAGGYDLELDRVKSIKATTDGSTRVEFIATGYYPAGKKTSDILCVVKNGKVKSFKHN